MKAASSSASLAVLPGGSTSNPNRWLRDGWRMAEREGPTVVGSIERKQDAERSAFQAAAQDFKARGHVALKRRIELEASLEAAGYDPARHLKELAQGKADLIWAIGLSVLSAALVVFVLLAFGPSWLGLVLSLTVLASTVAVEEFFQAYDEKASLREGIFLTLSILALTAQFWLGMLRGMFLAALTPEGVGPITEMLHQAGHILQYSLGALALVTETLCGYKWYRVRKQLGSGMAHLVRERDRLNDTLVAFHAAIQSAEREPDQRRAYREIGARQYLATQARAIPRKELSHFARAAIGAAIALLVLVILYLFVLPSPAAAAQQSGQMVILLDRTKSVSPDNFQKNLSAIASILNEAPSGYRVLIVGITDSFGRPEILFDQQVPDNPGYLGFDLRVARESLVFKWNRTARELAPIYDKSDLLGGLALLGHLGSRASDTLLIVFSDLRQSTSQLDLEHMAAIRSDQILARLKKQKAIPTLTHAKVFLLGVDPTGKSAEYFTSLKEFWIHFFAEAGATVEEFSVTRQMPRVVIRPRSERR
jgi:outer membrane protein OmpA-like peptidoglycan-associated protein